MHWRKAPSGSTGKVFYVVIVVSVALAKELLVSYHHI
jgi:hypothetical protein